MVLQSWLLVAHLEGYLSGQAPKGGLQGPDTTRGRCLDPHFFTNLRQAQLARLLIYFYLQNIPLHPNTNLLERESWYITTDPARITLLVKKKIEPDLICCSLCKILEKILKHFWNILFSSRETSLLFFFLYCSLY